MDQGVVWRGRKADTSGLDRAGRATLQKGCRKLRVGDPPRGERAGLRLHPQSGRGDGADLRSLECGELGSALRTGGPGRETVPRRVALDERYSPTESHG